MRFYIKLSLYLYVLIGFNISIAGSYADFFKAIEMDQPEVVGNLLARGFDPNSPSPKNVPALILSYQKKSMKVLDVLINSKKTNLNVISADGETLLMLAAINNQLSLADSLISKGADVNKPGWTALHYAASKGHIDLIRLLLDQQAYLDAESPNGTTPLMMAASYGSAMSVKLLLEEGADPRIKNKLGLTALDMAKQPEKEDAKRYLLAFTTAWNQKYSPQAIQQAERELAAMREKDETKEEDVVEKTAVAVEEKTAEPPVELQDTDEKNISKAPVEQAEAVSLDETPVAEPVIQNEDELQEAVTGPALQTSSIEINPIQPVFKSPVPEAIEKPVQLEPVLKDEVPRANEKKMTENKAVTRPSNEVTSVVRVRPLEPNAKKTPYSKQLPGRRVVTVDIIEVNIEDDKAD
ncbi:MAG: hypothetical protein RLZZ566_172 [Pseudomonadota bacterium]